MKKILLSITVLLVSATISLAQSASSAVTPGTNLISVGLGVGTPYFGTGYSSSLPINPTISYERGIVINNLTVGAELSYASSKLSFDDGFGTNYSITYSLVYVGVRGSYHFGELLSLPSKFDVYGGATVGFVAEIVSDNAGDAPESESAPGGGAFVGGKFYFTPRVGVYAEAGFTSLSYLNIGVTFKL